MEDLPLGRIAALVPEFAVNRLALGQNTLMMLVEDLALNRTAALVPEFAVNRLALGQNTLMMILVANVI